MADFVNLASVYVKETDTYYICEYPSMESLDAGDEVEFIEVGCEDTDFGVVDCTIKYVDKLGTEYGFISKLSKNPIMRILARKETLIHEFHYED